MYNLVLFYMEGGGGFLKDLEKFIEFFKGVVENGLCKVQLYLGLYYVDEFFSYCDYEKSVFYFKMVVVKKDLLVEYNFGICYECGFGIERDMLKVVSLYMFVVEYGYIGV